MIVSFTVSVAVFWATKEVEKALGANGETREAVRMAVLVRNDIVIDLVVLVRKIEVE